jgi:hypothetical protein
MEDCLSMPEIVQEICWFVGNVDFSLENMVYETRNMRKSRQALVNLAKANSRFSAPATEVLWYQFGTKLGLEPLMDSVADDLCDYGESMQERVRLSGLCVSKSELANVGPSF